MRVRKEPMCRLRASAFRTAFAFAARWSGIRRSSVPLRRRYFFRRVTKPAARDPKPRSPSKGSGEAVCGRLPAALFCAVSVPALALAPLSALLWPAAAPLLALVSVPVLAAVALLSVLLGFWPDAVALWSALWLPLMPLLVAAAELSVVALGVLGVLAVAAAALLLSLAGGCEDVAAF